MIEAGTLRDKVLVLALSLERNEYGEQVRTWREVYAPRAKVTYNKGIRAINAGEVWLPNTISVLVRYNPIINDRCRIVWDSKVYAIDSVNSSQSDGSTTITATKIKDEQDSDK